MDGLDSDKRLFGSPRCAPTLVGHELVTGIASHGHECIRLDRQMRVSIRVENAHLGRGVRILRLSQLLLGNSIVIGDDFGRSS